MLQVPRVVAHYYVYTYYNSLTQYLNFTCILGNQALCQKVRQIQLCK